MGNEVWQLAGKIIGTSIARKRAKEMEHLQRLQSRPPPSMFQPVRPPLPVEAWHSSSVAAFGYPWGWEEIDLASVTGADKSFVCYVHAHRSDEGVANLQVMCLDSCSREELLDSVASMESEAAEKLGMSPHMPMELLKMDGEPAVAVHLVGPARNGPGTGAVTMVFATHRRRLYQIQLTAPEPHHAAYLPVLWTALGTWSWR